MTRIKVITHVRALVHGRDAHSIDISEIAIVEAFHINAFTIMNRYIQIIFIKSSVYKISVKDKAKSRFFFTFGKKLCKLSKIFKKRTLLATFKK